MRTLLLLFVFFSSQVGRAQNYQCLQPGARHYFTNGNGYLRGIRIDSTTTYPDSTVYHPFRTPRGSYGPPGATSTLDGSGGSWIGKHVVQISDGTTLFDNFWHDTVVIKTQAHTGDSWTFFRDNSTTVYYNATLTAEDTMTVYGAVDSIKRISITTWNGSTNLTYDSLNNLELILSKNNGLAQAIDFYTFPCDTPGLVNTTHTGIDFYLDASTVPMAYPAFHIRRSPTGVHDKNNTVFSLSDFTPPTYMDLYQWNAGDEYEYSISTGTLTPPVVGSAPPDEFDDYVITAVTPGSGLTQYTYSGRRDTFDGSLSSTSGIYTSHYSANSTGGTLTYNSTSPIDSLMPEELGQRSVYYYVPSDSTFCTVAAVYGIEQSGMSGASYLMTAEASYPITYYKKPLGLLSTEHYDLEGSTVEYSKRLVFYNRSGSPCGFHALSSVKNVPEINTISVSPNPASSYIHVAVSATPCIISLQNLLGQLVKTVYIASQTATMDVSDIPAGVYNMVITSGSDIHCNKKVMILR